MTMTARAAMAFQEGFSAALNSDVEQPLQQTMAVMLEHFGGELLLLDQEHPGMKAHEAARLFFDAARQEVEQ
jgi:hypothetical protein